MGQGRVHANKTAHLISAEPEKPATLIKLKRLAITTSLLNLLNLYLMKKIITQKMRCKITANSHFGTHELC